MRFDWREYLLLAWQLLGRRGFRAVREALERSAISRAYYAAFIIARNYLRDSEGVAVPRRDAHLFVIDYFEMSRDPQRVIIGQRLRYLRNARTRADYDDMYLDLFHGIE